MAILFSSPASGAAATVLISLTGYTPVQIALPNPGPGVLYTTPSGKFTTIASIEIFNNSAAVAVVKLYINTTGTRIPFKGASMNDQDTLVDTLSRALPAGCTIEAECNQNNVFATIQMNEQAV